MTWPVTPDPAIHDDTQSVQQTSFFSASQILTWAEQLPLAMVKDLVDAILSALGLGGVVPTANTIITDVYNALLDIPQGNISGLISNLEDIVGTIITALGGTTIGKDFEGLLAEAQSLLGGLAHTIESDIAGALTDIEQLVENPIGTIESWVAALEKLLGLDGGSSTGTGTTTGSGSTGVTIGSNTQSLANLISALGTNEQVTSAQLSTLAPGTSNNVQTDPNFSANYTNGNGWVPFGDIQGQGQWYWDGFQGTTPAGGSVRTKRSGSEVITVFWLTGTFVPGAYVTEVPAFFREYFLDPDGEALGYYGVTGEGFNLGIDHTFFEFVPVAYGGCMFPMKQTIAQGVSNLIQMINATPGKFILTGWSQGAHVISNVYDLLRYGTYSDGANTLTNTSLMSRRQDFLAGIALGNPRRQEGYTFPGFPDPEPGSAGVNMVQLANCEEDIWWEICLAGDPAATVPLTGQLGYWMRLLWEAIVDKGTSSNSTTIAGLPIVAALEDLIDSGLAWTALWDIITDPAVIPTVIQAAEDFFQLTTHDSYWTYKPFTAQGDTRNIGQIICQFISSFEPLVNPPVNGNRFQLLGNLVAVQPEQVVTAACQVMWSQIAATGDQIILAVNAYDVNNNLIATITYSGATITDPEPTTNYTWIPLSGAFVMPPGAASACLVFDVEPEAMTTGIVWFTAASLEITTLLDAALLDVTNMPQLTAAKVAGPQQEADLLTAWQNQIDGLASAASQTNITGADLSTLFSAVGQAALNAANALQLGVSNSQILSPSNVPLSNSLGTTGDVTFPLASWASATSTITTGTAMMGLMSCLQAGDKTFIEFMAENTGATTGVYINVYTVDPTTGNMTAAWSSADISSTMSTSSLSWVAVNISSAVAVVVNQLVAVEIVAQGSAVSVATKTDSTPNKTTVPPNWGATRTTSTTGGVSPTSLTLTQLSFGGTRPYICFGIAGTLPVYQPPNQQSYNNNGMFTYTIPSFLQSGDFLDVVALGAGGGGGNAIVGSSGILGFGATPTVNGQGGQPGAWAAETFTYGTDIPSDITELTAIVGNGGNSGTSGGDSSIGYGLNTPTFDAVGAGNTGSGASVNMSWSHTIGTSATALVVPVYVYFYNGQSTVTETVTVGGIPMAKLGATPHLVYSASAFSVIYMFGLINPPTGAQTINVKISTGAQSSLVAANSLSYNNVSNFGAPVTTTGSTTSAAQSVMSDSNQMVVQAFGSVGTSFSSYNQTQRYAVSGSIHNWPLVIGDAAGSSTVNFTATAPTAHFAGIAVALQPALSVVLLDAAGGVAGGNGGNFNPANSNTNLDGLTPGNKKFEGTLYVGGATLSTGGWPGNVPGGAGSGGFSTLPPGGVGADGTVWFTGRQSNTPIISAGVSGGGSELSVSYEAMGTGGANSSASALEWSHTSSGGSTCAVVLFGSLSYSNGTASIGCSYGSTSFIYALDWVEYFNSGGTGLVDFCFGLIGPASGTQTVTVNVTGTATENSLVGNTVSYQNVGSFGNFYATHGATEFPTLSGISSSTGQIVVGAVAGKGHVLNSFNQTSRWSSSSTIPMVIGDAAGGSTVSFTAATSADDAWAVIGGVLLPVS